MVVNQPHFLLFCDTNLSTTKACAVGDQGFGRWHFVLERLDGPERLEVADSEASVHRDRLALLAVVRGLEALEQPSNVTLVTTSRYVSRGLRYGLNEWREAEYTWEHFGSQRPIRNADLWQRVDRALGFHQITCRLLQSQFAQAVVETVAEMDELTMLSQPMITEASVQKETAPVTAVVAEQVVSAGKAVVSEPREPVKSGRIVRVDAAHLPTSQQKVSEIIGTNPRRQVLAKSRIASRACMGPLPLANSSAAARPALHRPKISISIPVFHFHHRWWQLAMAWMRWLRWWPERSAPPAAIAPT
jgi:ribonuclease HI